MINLRYHIVSITAVFLALGIGLAFGASFIQAGTIGALEQNLNEIEAQNDDLGATNGELRARIDDARELEDGLRSQGLSQLVAGQLTDVPVLVFANDGIDDGVVTAAESAVVAAGARVAGVLRITERFVLDDQSEVDDLRAILALPSAGPGQLRVAATRQVATILRDAGRPAPEPTGDEEGDPVELTSAPVLDALLGAGFLVLDPIEETTDAGTALVPAAGLRVLALSGDDSEVPDSVFLTPVLRGVLAVDATDPGALPPVVVAAQPTLPADAETDPGTLLVGPLRADDVLRLRVSTVDDVESFAGLVATVLALSHGAAGQTGHYGLRDDAQSLLPPALVVEGAG